MSSACAPCGSMMEVMESSTTPRMGRRSMALSDIDPKYVSQSGIWKESEVETSRGSIRIQHLTAAATTSSSSSGARPRITSVVNPVPCSSGSTSNTSSTSNINSSPRFPKLEECAHFHYDCVELPSLKIQIRDDPTKPIGVGGDEITDKCAFSVEVIAGGQSWTIRRTHTNIEMLDIQLHRCVWDRTFSLLSQLPQKSDQECEHSECRSLVQTYLARLSELPTNKITCGTVLSWLELDNRGRHIVSSDDSAINTPAVAAACALKKYAAQATDEISFEVGDMISVIDMPRPEESIWWRGKRGFHVGFFPREYVQVIGDKVSAAGLPIQSVRRLQRLSVSSSNSTSPAPDKPVLRKHGKLIAFFRSFILSRPSRRRLKQSGILRERVFSCDLAEHLLNSGSEIPTVLQCCSEFIEKHGIVDGVYRLSGITSNIQKLRNAFDEDKIPNLEGDLAIKQDIHAVSSLLKMYFRELPNPLCTYQFYDKFVSAAKESDEDRLLKMREVVHELPPPHYRTLEYLMKHLSRVAQCSRDTGMTPKNMAIVWAPNLIRCKELEAGGVAALKGIGVQAVVTEYLIRHADLIFNDKLPVDYPTTTTVLNHKASSSPSNSDRPKSLSISSPIKLMSLEEAQGRLKDDRKYIEVGGGPSSLPPKYHTVIELPSRRGGLKAKRSQMSWRHFFSRNRSFSKPPRRAFTPGDITVITRSMPVAGPQGMQTNWASRLRPVKSVESLVSSPLHNNDSEDVILSNLDSETTLMNEMESELSKSSPSTPVMTDAHVMFHKQPSDIDSRNLHLQFPKTHNRSISHDSYFEFGEFRNKENVYIDETLEEEDISQSSKLSLELSSSELESNDTSPIREKFKINTNLNSTRPKSEEKEQNVSFKSPVTPPPSAASAVSIINDDIVKKYIISNPRNDMEYSLQLHKSKWRDSEVQTSQLKLSDVGVCTEDDSYSNSNPGRVSTGIDCCMDAFSSGVAYELDKNSSFDDSSDLSTPEEAAKGTNIVYSPLINDMSSTSSAEHLIAPKRSISSTSTQKSHDSESYASFENAIRSSSTASSNMCLFVCPLYEAGVTPESFQAPPMAVEVLQPVISTSLKSPVPTPTPPIEHSYANDSAAVAQETQFSKEICHIYENERIYQNHPIPPVRKIRPDPFTPLNGPGTEKIEMNNSSTPDETPIPKPKPKPKAREPLPTTCVSEICEKNEEAYENINEDQENKYEFSSNIYEDIDDDEEDLKKPEFKDDDCENRSCRYEIIGTSESSINKSHDNLNANTNYLENMANNNSFVGCGAGDSSTEDDGEGTNAYESINFQKLENRQLPAVGHHYTEIEEKTSQEEEIFETQSESTTPSHSRTDEMITYLEMPTSGLQSQLDTLYSEEKKSPDDDLQLKDNGNGGYESVRRFSEETIDPNTDSNNEPQTPDSVDQDGEIRFIDSPLIVENPVYTLEIDGIDVEEQIRKGEEADADISMTESISISAAEADAEDTSITSFTEKTKELKLLGRCNSAPLAETGKEFIILTEIFQRQSDSKGDKDMLEKHKLRDRENSSSLKNNSLSEKSSLGKENEKIPLSKRLSEPFLHNLKSQQQITDDSSSTNANVTAWKVADAKRLANRKQSVKELLSKFESRDSTPSPSGSISSSSGGGGAFHTLPHLRKDQQGPGLPKPAISENKEIKKKNGGSGRFQHHRFSVGDILMTQSMTDANDEILNSNENSKQGRNIMIRSDTFPELRNSNSNSGGGITLPSELKYGQNSKENVTLMSPLGNVDDPLAQKAQEALRVAMTSVDMNDPNTRERIEKYKQERRTFLRQKIISEMSNSDIPQQQQQQAGVPAVTQQKSLPSPKPMNVSSPTNEIFMTASQNSCSSESPRKRAFTEESPVNLNRSSGNKLTKSIKTEPEPMTLIFSDESSSTTMSTRHDEINVKEKIAMWTVQKKEMSKSTIEICANANRSTEPQQQQNKERQLTRERQPVLRREVTTSSIEISKSRAKLVQRSVTTVSDDSLSVSGAGGGKKIKDMAAFFESKRI